VLAPGKGVVSACLRPSESAADAVVCASRGTAPDTRATPLALASGSLVAGETVNSVGFARASAGVSASALVVEVDEALEEEVAAVLDVVEVATEESELEFVVEGSEELVFVTVAEEEEDGDVESDGVSAPGVSRSNPTPLFSTGLKFKAFQASELIFRTSPTVLTPASRKI